ncbi:hypothetical protein [Paraburkholderia phenazinium]|uniref:hypothetical protein n=1 Tax=Paraburkholderia phenazinium TaxID=60549 RepID=UPI001FC8BC59|nr:hypothetical protein [Paraburkholderia phenazinium]
MHKDALLKALADPGSVFNQQEPPERAVFFYDDEVRQCCSILHSLIDRSMRAPARPGNRQALPLPDIDLPLVF